MKKIPLTQGQVALVDDEDYDRINAHKWYARFDRTTNSYYAMRNSPTDGNGKRKTILMHREVMNAKDGEQVDHINHETLNQQKPHLRLCSCSQNCSNRGLRPNNTSGFKGVSLDKPTGKWKAYVSVDRKRRHIGYFETALKAAVAYDAAAILYYGSSARTNAMMGLIPSQAY